MISNINNPYSLTFTRIGQHIRFLSRFLGFFPEFWKKIIRHFVSAIFWKIWYWVRNKRPPKPLFTKFYSHQTTTSIFVQVFEIFSHCGSVQFLKYFSTRNSMVTFILTLKLTFMAFWMSNLTFLNGNPLFSHLQSIERKILRSSTYPSQVNCNVQGQLEVICNKESFPRGHCNSWSKFQQKIHCWALYWSWLQHFEYCKTICIGNFSSTVPGVLVRVLFLPKGLYRKVLYLFSIPKSIPDAIA